MGYLLLAVVFYTVVRFGTDIWTILRYERQNMEETYQLHDKITKLENEIDELKKEKGPVTEL